MIIRLHDNGELHLSVYVYELKGLVDESALRRAVEALTVNHPILRATWAKSNSGYCQVLLPTTAVSFSSFDGCILNHIQQTKAVILTPRQRNGNDLLDYCPPPRHLRRIHTVFARARFGEGTRGPDDILQRGPPQPWYGDFAQYLKTHQDDEKAFKYWNDYIKGSTTEVVCRGPLGPTREHSILTNSMAITVPKKHQVELGAVIVTA
ncbi:hypothetical protein NYO67_12082 [Aspergillus flavus]|nr:hypothetical protein NYO67_12082 [Aspergillus flavus]